MNDLSQFVTIHLTITLKKLPHVGGMIGKYCARCRLWMGVVHYTLTSQLDVFHESKCKCLNDAIYTWLQLRCAVCMHFMIVYFPCQTCLLK